VNIQETYSLMDVCLGNIAPDLLIKSCSLVDVYTGEILEDQDIAIKGGYFAYVGKWKYSISGISQIIDAKNLYAVPGMIDGHTHLLYLMSPYEAIKHIIPTGTTTIVTEVMEIYPIGGVEGIRDFINMLKDQPIRFFFTVPSMVTTPESLKGMATKELKELLAMEEVLGMGESYWQAILGDRETFVPNMVLTRMHKKSLEGHSAGARNEKLMAYAAIGVGSCHEPITATEALERARLGFHVMIREGAVRKDLKAISQLLSKVDTRRFVLSSDGVDPEELMEQGYMDSIVRKAISFGVEPVKAVQMATLNVAEHFHMDDFLGGIAPAKFADLVLIEDLKGFYPRYVISSGRLIAEDRRIISEPRPISFNPSYLNRLRRGRVFQREDFLLRAPKGGSVFKVLAMEMVTDLVTQRVVLELPQMDGIFLPNEHKDLSLVSAVDRLKPENGHFTGLLKGFGLRKGAFGCSAGWDSTDMILVGKDPWDMAVAANRIFELQGGAVVVVEGRVIWELGFPILGIMSLLNVEDLVQAFKDLKRILEGLGVSFRDPLLSLVTLSTSAIPFFRICHEGYKDLKTGRIEGLFIS